VERKKHLTEETIAALVDGQLDEREAAEARDHLAACRSCTAAFSEAVRFRTLWLDDPHAFAPHESLVRAGRKVPSLTSSPAASRRRRQPLSIGWRPVGLALGMGLIALVFFLVTQPQFGLIGPNLDGASIACLTDAIVSAPTQGMVLPGAEQRPPAGTPAYRSGSPTDADLRSAVQTAETVYERGRQSADVAVWLVGGQICIGQLGKARIYVREARRRFPEEPRLALLEAIIAYRESDLDRAEHLLRAEMVRNPQDDLVRLNLGLLLSQRGRRGEATDLLQRIQNEALVPRAAALLESLDAR